MMRVADHRDGNRTHQHGAFQPVFIVKPLELRPEGIGLGPAADHQDAALADRFHRGDEGIDVFGNRLIGSRIDHDSHETLFLPRRERNGDGKQGKENQEQSLHSVKNTPY